MTHPPFQTGHSSSWQQRTAVRVPPPVSPATQALLRDAIRLLITAVEQRDILSADALACAVQQGRHVLMLTDAVCPSTHEENDDGEG